jgi:carbamoyl-phosphate synthase large subunit
VLLDVSSADRLLAVEVARRLRALGYGISAVDGTALSLAAARLPATTVARGDAEAALRRGDYVMAIVTAEGDAEIATTKSLRRAALGRGVPCFTSTALARAACSALEEDAGPEHVQPLQHWYAQS